MKDVMYFISAPQASAGIIYTPAARGHWKLRGAEGHFDETKRNGRVEKNN